MAHRKKFNFAKVDELQNIIKEDDWKEARDKDIEARFENNLKAKNEKQERYINAIETSVITFGIGPAGTGRTYVACGMAAKLLDEKKIEKIILTRPVVECGGEKIGFLPGNSWEKVAPYFAPMLDALEEFYSPLGLERLINKGVIKLSPLAQMRGSSFKNSIIILDEAQNCNFVQLKMALTRIGTDCRMVISGDYTQSDLKGQNDLLKIIKKLEPLPEIAVVRFNKQDIVRSGIVRRIIETLDDDK